VEDNPYISREYQKMSEIRMQRTPYDDSDRCFRTISKESILHDLEIDLNEMTTNRSRPYVLKIVPPSVQSGRETPDMFNLGSAIKVVDNPLSNIEENCNDQKPFSSNDDLEALGITPNEISDSSGERLDPS
jgi:hypothetical protein